MKVLHIITGLSDGGAEGVLYRLCKYDTKAQHIVISMMNEGKYGQLLKEAGIDVYLLNMHESKFNPSVFWRFYRLIFSLKPDLVQTWMYHADLIGGLVAYATNPPLYHIFETFYSFYLFD